MPPRGAALALLTAGCLPSIADLDTGPLTSTFAVSDFFAPSGYMGDGEFFGKLQGAANEGCKPNASLHRGNCYSFTYWPNDTDANPWAGVFWVFPANSWGSTSGHAIDISKFKQISFWAAVDGPTPYTDGGIAVPFEGQAGGIDPQGRYVNDAGTTKDYVDGVLIKTGWPIGDPASGITSEMKQLHIPLSDFAKGAGCQDPHPTKPDGTPKTNDKAPNCVFPSGMDEETGYKMGLGQATFLIGAFEWDLHYPTDQVPGCLPKVNPNTGMPIDCHTGYNSSLFVNPPPIHIYLDDIVWDTQDPPAP